MTEIKLSSGKDIIYQSPAMEKVIKKVDDYADTDFPILLTGENGTGKENIAQLIHDRSKRKDHPFHAINCAAIAPSLIEDELFGHEKGAFTGADKVRKGAFESANGGTLFLDEIGEMSPELQAKLLRVIQEGKFHRVGGSEEIIARPRIIAATNRNIETALEKGTLKQDIYHRLNRVVIHVADLKERGADIPLLAEYFARKAAEQLGCEAPQISNDAIAALLDHEWSGNVRELENTIFRAAVPAVKYNKGIITSEMLGLGEAIESEKKSRILAFTSTDHLDIGAILTRDGDKKISHAEISRATGLSRHTIRDFINSEVGPNLGPAVKLGYYLKERQGEDVAILYFKALMRQLEAQKKARIGDNESEVEIA